MVFSIFFFICQIFYIFQFFFQDTCYDEEDGQTSQLSLRVITNNRRELSPEAWLQFDDKNQEFVGIPLESEVGREEYQLVCSDTNGLSAVDGIEVIVLNRPFNERFGIGTYV